MRVSDITTSILAQYLRLDDSSDTLLQPILDAAKANVATLTGLTDEELDEHEDITPAVLILAQDFYDNRQYQFDRVGSHTNEAVDAIVASHRVNLV